MTPILLLQPKALRLLTLAALFSLQPAWADDYSDVNALLRAGKNAEAAARADQYLAAKPRDPQMRFLKGVIQTESGRTADAITTFSRLTEDYPELPEPYNNLAVLYAAQNQFDKARAALEMAIRTNPSYSTAHENLGDVYAKLASQAYNKALQLDTSNTGVQPKLALIREIFSTTAKGQKTTPAPAAATVPPAAAAPVVTAAAPAVPVPAAKAVAPAAAPAAAAGNAPGKEVEAAVLGWAGAWSAKDIAGYLGAYGKEFTPPGNLSRKAWEDERRARILGKSRISVKLTDIAVSVNGSEATARFKQAYSADGLNVSSRKTLTMLKTGERWVIVKESTGA